MEDGEFIDLDSDKEVWLLDVGAFRRWEISRFNDSDGVKHRRLPNKQRYLQLRKEALKLYTQIYQGAEALSEEGKVRLFRYLAGESMDDIAKSETPVVTRQAIQKDLRRALKTISAEQARQIWFYGQHYGKLS